MLCTALKSSLWQLALLRGPPLQTLKGAHASSLLCRLVNLLSCSSLACNHPRSSSRPTNDKPWWWLDRCKGEGIIPGPCYQCPATVTSESIAYWVSHGVCSLWVCAECASYTFIKTHKGKESPINHKALRNTGHQQRGQVRAYGWESIETAGRVRSSSRHVRGSVRERKNRIQIHFQIQPIASQ